jgi:hypothetical protein
VLGAQVGGAWQAFGIPPQNPVQHSPPLAQAVPFEPQGAAQTGVARVVLQ